MIPAACPVISCTLPAVLHEHTCPRPLLGPVRTAAVADGARLYVMRTTVSHATDPQPICCHPRLPLAHGEQGERYELRTPILCTWPPHWQPQVNLKSPKPCSVPHMALLPHGQTTGRALCRSPSPCSGQKPSIVVVVVVVVVVVSPHFRCFLYVCQANSRASGAAAESTITNVSGRSAAAPPRLAARDKRNYLYPRHAATGLRAANSAA